MNLEQWTQASGGFRGAERRALRWRPWVLCLLGTLWMTSSARAEPNVPSDAVVGRWWNPERSGQIEIYRDGSHYFGKIVSRKDNVLDAKNPDPTLRSRRVVGVVFLTDFQFDGKDRWKGGKIYVFRTGDTVDGELWIEDGTLVMRGFKGLWIFGKTFRMERVLDAPETG
ncbi:MAG: DUF2147 domain-containing protein [Myxococcota bacterium]